ncbi:hypothetical protein F2Q70_00019881 [Brassica cretica]|uniref:Uncharacterized protein n=1 Tax=Brassica cretica TaxID=69181 RepID=A0A8S9GRV1_BRACR|nr:hypothetical protein F2Q70_00019881 [Brassica cretica]
MFLALYLGNPNKPQYNGGIIVNPGLQNGLEGWSQYGNDKVNFTEFEGNKFVIVRGRNQPYDSVKAQKHATWLQVGQGNAPVRAVFKKNGEHKHAELGCTVESNIYGDKAFQNWFHQKIRLDSFLERDEMVQHKSCKRKRGLLNHISDGKSMYNGINQERLDIRCKDHIKMARDVADPKRRLLQFDFQELDIWTHAVFERGGDGCYNTLSQPLQYSTGENVEPLSKKKYLGNPNKPQYNGGIIVNPGLQNGLEGWSQYGNDKVNFTEFEGNKFVIVRGRNQPYDSVSQNVCLEKGLLCTFSACNLVTNRPRERSRESRLQEEW